DFSTGTLVMTEAGTKKRAAIHLVRGADALAEHDPGGLEPLTASLEEFRAALTTESHTLKRALTDPTIFSGIGNAYGDEILHRARLSPVKLTRALSDDETKRLYEATRATLADWIERLRREAGGEFPEGVTAFRPAMAVHGRFRQPCPDCGAPVQRIVYAENETNYCPRRQTGARALDRLAIRQDILVDAREIDTTTSLCGVPLSWPVVIAPMGGLVLFHDEGDVEMGRGAERADTLQFLSGASGWSVETVAAASKGPKIFQLYHHGDRAWVADLLARVEASGYLSVCLTVDVQVYSRRERDILARWSPREAMKKAPNPRGPDANYPTRL